MKYHHYPIQTPFFSPNSWPIQAPGVWCISRSCWFFSYDNQHRLSCTRCWTTYVHVVTSSWKIKGNHLPYIKNNRFRRIGIGESSVANLSIFILYPSSIAHFMAAIGTTFNNCSNPSLLPTSRLRNTHAWNRLVSPILHPQQHSRKVPVASGPRFVWSTLNAGGGGYSPTACSSWFGAVVPQDLHVRMEHIFNHKIC